MLLRLGHAASAFSVLLLPIGGSCHAYISSTPPLRRPLFLLLPASPTDLGEFPPGAAAAAADRPVRSAASCLGSTAALQSRLARSPASAGVATAATRSVSRTALASSA